MDKKQPEKAVLRGGKEAVRMVRYWLKTYVVRVQPDALFEREASLDIHYRICCCLVPDKKTGVLYTKERAVDRWEPGRLQTKHYFSGTVFWARAKIHWKEIGGLILQGVQGAAGQLQ